MRSSRKECVSVVVPTFNEQGNIGRLIKSVKKQTCRNVEVIIVDDGSSDLTVEVAKNLGANVFSREHAERSVQRNFGAKKAKGRYLLFLDADMELSKNVIRECVEKVKKDKKIGAVVIPERSIAKTFWEKVKAFERSFYNLEGDTVTDAARFFTRAAFNEVGGYDPKITGPEDWDLPDTVRKKGYKIARIKSKILHHERIPSLFSLAKKKYYYGLKSHRYLSKQRISPVSPKTIYFLRSVFYKNWKKLVANPLMSIAMIIMLSVEMVSGGIGYVIGKARKL